MPTVHASAVVDDRVHLADDALIGPHCIVEGEVTLGPGARLLGQNWVRGPATIGAGSTLYPGACLGGPPQHTAIDHDAPNAGVTLGERVVLREHATVHASMGSERPTTIGDRCYLMATAHIGHDCTLHEDVIVAGAAVIAGHCEIMAKAFISGGVQLHQYVRVGRLAMLSGGTGTSLDVPPFGLVADRNTLSGLNLIGMRRAEIPRDEITNAKEAYRRVMSRNLTVPEIVASLEELGRESPICRELHDFYVASARGVIPGDGRPQPHTLRWLRRWIKTVNT